MKELDEERELLVSDAEITIIHDVYLMDNIDDLGGASCARSVEKSQEGKGAPEYRNLDPAGDVHSVSGPGDGEGRHYDDVSLEPEGDYEGQGCDCSQFNVHMI